MTFLASRPMEDFFINPLFDMKNRSFSTPDAFGLYDAFPQHKRAASTYQPDKHTRQSSTMSSVKPSSASMAYVPEQPDYFHGYASDEEIASPDDVSDNLSFPSSEDGTEQIGIALSPDTYVAETFQQFSRAQAVRIQPAGKPRIVTLPKLDLSYRRTSRPSTSFNDSRRGSRLGSMEGQGSTRSSQESHSRNDSMDSSTANSPASTAPSSVDGEELSRVNSKKAGSLRHIPLMKAVKTLTPTDSFEIPRSATLPRRSIDPANRHSTDLSERYFTPTSPTTSYRPSIRKMGKFSSIINLTLGRDSRDTPDTQSLYSVQESEASTVSTKVAPRNAPARSLSTQQRRLVARGANERAPPMTLPPCPYE